MRMIKKITSNHITDTLIVGLLVLGSLFCASTTYGLDSSNNVNSNIINNNAWSVSINGNKTIDNKKAVIIAFDDAWKSQFTNAKPILDKYGFKGSFFIVCNYVGKNPDRMTWNDIQTLERQGHDIESHSMNHIPLDDLSQQQLNYEIGQSKQCIIDHSVSLNNSNNNDVPIFAYPYDIGHTNATVIDTVAKYYQIGRTGDKPLAFLNCDLSLANKKNGSVTPSDYATGICKSRSARNIISNNNNNKTNLVNATYYDQLGTLNQYSIRSWTHHPHNPRIYYSSSQMFDQFVQEVNSQDKYNVDGIINSIPIITYHNFTNFPLTKYTKNEYSTDVGLFSKEMKYLYDNHYIVLPMSTIQYNEQNKNLYLNITK
jgi:peptidoglycan/xylan/chitin deacetylase (PgdA/CDA1 family)